MFGSIRVLARGAAAPDAAIAEGRIGHEVRERERLRGCGPVLDTPQALQERVSRRRLHGSAELENRRRRQYSMLMCCLP